jgi:hypothetical protein
VISCFCLSVNEDWALLGFYKCRMVVCCWRLGTSYWFHLQGWVGPRKTAGPMKMGPTGCPKTLVETIPRCVLSQNRTDLKVANVVKEILELHVKCWIQEAKLLNVQLILTISWAFSGRLNFQFFWFYCFEGISESADGHVLSCQCLSDSCFVNTKLLNFCTAKYPPRNERGFINIGIAA